MALWSYPAPVWLFLCSFEPIKRLLAKMLVSESMAFICFQETHLRLEETKYLKEVFKETMHQCASSVKGIMIDISLRGSWLLEQAATTSLAICSIKWLSQPNY